MCRVKYANSFRTWNRPDLSVSMAGKEVTESSGTQSFPGFVLISGHDGDDAQQYQESKFETRCGIYSDESQDSYLMFVRWSEEDNLYVGYCPDLFPAGGVCHGATSEAYAKLCEIVEDTVQTAQE